MVFHTLCQLALSIFARNKLSILIYHQVLEIKDPMRPSEPCAKEFRWQMGLIKKYFTPLSLAQAHAHLKKGTLPSNAICVTFDDGYLNNLTVAAPILTEFDIPATCFIASGFSGGDNMFNDLLIDLVGCQSISNLSRNSVNLNSVVLKDYPHRRKVAHELIDKVKYLPIVERKRIIDELYQENNVSFFPSKMMTLEQVCELEKEGVEIGAHTVDHPILKSLSSEDQLNQIKQNKEQLESYLGKDVVAFAYPNGKPNVDYSQETAKIVEQLGFRYAVSTAWGTSTKETNCFELKRFTPWDKNPKKFHLRLMRNLLNI